MSTKKDLSNNDCKVFNSGHEGPSFKAIDELQDKGHRVKLLGKIVNGKVQIDEDQLKEFSKEFPNANMAFVAVNAPFDPVVNQEV